MTSQFPEPSNEPLVSFPIKLTANIDVGGVVVARNIVLNSGLTVILGPNGSGKTHLLRSLKGTLPEVVSKQVRFISAGRIGMFEQYRSISNRHTRAPQYEDARFGQYSDQNGRHLVETLQGDYQTLAARPDILLKIRERLQKLFKRDINLSWESSELKVNFIHIKGARNEYSSAREASGLVHLVGLLAALYDDDIGALLLDEPEVSLHPQLQAFLLREIVRVAGIPGDGYKKIIVVSTHSTEFLRIDQPYDLPNLLFCTDLSENLVQISQDAEELHNKKIAELISRMGQEHKLAFFARSPLLVEGPSDTIICAGLASKLDIHIEAGGSQLLPVIGKGQFPVVVKLMRMMGKKPMVLADADAFTDGNQLANSYLNSSSANDTAAKSGHGTAMNFFKKVHADFCSTVESGWSEIKTLAEKSAYWEAGLTGAEELTVKRRSAFTALFTSHTKTIKGPWPAMKSRLEALLNLLEGEGCFILRRGTIEAYYSKPIFQLTDGKPSAAAEEVLVIRAENEDGVENRYADVLRCLRMAAASEEISEADVIQDALLAVAGPALAWVRNKQADVDLNAQARTLGIPSAELFDLKNHDGKLLITLKSKVLDVKGFPITIGAHEDVVSRVSEALGTAKRL